jgi:hypothetical protein
MVYSITDLINQWQDWGIFDFMLPFLIIFAFVFAILDKTKILGENKGVSAVLGIAIGLIAITNQTVINTFRTIFPFASIGISVLLVAIILMGFVSYGQDNKGWHKYIWFGLGLAAFLFVLRNTADTMGIFNADWAAFIAPFAAIAVLIVLVVLIVRGNDK